MANHEKADDNVQVTHICTGTDSFPTIVIDSIESDGESVYCLFIKWMQLHFGVLKFISVLLWNDVVNCESEKWTHHMVMY